MNESLKVPLCSISNFSTSNKAPIPGETIPRVKYTIDLSSVRPPTSS